MSSNNGAVSIQLPPNFQAGSESTATNYVSMEMGGVVAGAVDQQQAPEGFEDEFNDEFNEFNNDNNDHQAPSIVSSVVSADGIHDMTGFKVNCTVTLVGEMSRGVFFPTLWPLVASLGGNSVTLGYAVGAFSAGRIVMVPVFSSLSESIGYRTTLGMSVAILLLGFVLYAQVENVGHALFLIFAQFILGMGSGTLGVTRAFVAEVTAKRNRTTYMAWITSVEFAGSNVTPFVGALLSKVLGDSNFQVGYVLLFFGFFCRSLL